MSIIWDESYSVGVKEIDEQHKYYIELLEKINQNIELNRSRQDLGKMFEEFIEYADFHFSTEENYFDKFKFELAAEHKSHHDKLKAELKDFYTKFKNGDNQISREFIDFLENWLVHHSYLEDRLYTECFNKNNLY